MLTTLPVYADISYNRHIKVDAAGAMSMLSSEGNVVTLLSADKSRTEDSITMKSKLAGMFAGSDQVTAFRITTEITRWSDAPIAPERVDLPAGWTKR